MFRHLIKSISIDKDSYEYSNGRQELADFSYRLIDNYLVLNNPIRGEELWGWLEFSYLLDRVSNRIRERDVLREVLSRDRELKYAVFFAGFESWKDDFGLYSLQQFLLATSNAYEISEIIQYCFRALEEVDKFYDKHVQLYKILGNEIFSQGYKEYTRFEQWLAYGESNTLLASEMENVLICPIEEWRQKDNRYKRERERKEQTKKEKDREALLSTRDQMRMGHHIYNLSLLARFYFDEFTEDVDPVCVLRNRVSLDVLDYVLDGFLATLKGNDVPTAYEIGQLGGTYYRSWSTIIAGMEEAIRRNIAFSDLDVKSLESAFALGLRLDIFIKSKDKSNQRTGITLPWVKEIIKSDPVLTERCVEQLSRGAFDKKQEFNVGVRALRYQAIAPDLKSKISICLLRDYPGMNAQHLYDLVALVLKSSSEDKFELRKLAHEVLSKKGSIRGKQRAVWLIVGFILEPEFFTDKLKQYISTREWVVWEIRSLIFIVKDGRDDLTLSIEQIESLAIWIAKFFPNAYMPTGKTITGDRCSWDAAEMVRGLVDKLSSFSTQEAAECMERLLLREELSSYKDHIAHSKYNQRRLLNQSLFNQPSWQETIRSLDNLEPANSEDLYALILDHLEHLKTEIRQSPTSIFRRFWRHGSRGVLVEPDIEEHCRDRLIELLKPRLVPLGLRVEPEGHMADDKRVDIVIYPPPGQKLPIELKRDFHPDVWTASNDQLDRLYTPDPEASGFGIYVVFWFGDGRGASLPNPPEGESKPKTATQMELVLNAQISEENSRRLKALVIDVSSGSS